MGGVLCCCPEDTNFDPEIFRDKANSRDVATHPSDSSIALTVHQPLYPPGRIIHIVRNHPKKEEKLVKKHDPVYQALWADNVDFDEVLISPVMVQDHMPDKVLDALEKLLVNTGPAKPQRQLSEGDRRQLSNTGSIEMGSRTPPHRLVLETSFTDLQPDSEEVLCYGYQNRSNPNWDYNGVGVVIDESKENDVEKRDWMQMAPLASPETLSDVSSVSSKESNQKVINGNRISWGGVPPMDPIAQSPAVHRPNSDSLTVPMKKYDRRTMRVDSGTGLEENLTYPLCYKVVTEATVEMNAERESNCSPHLMDPSHLCLNIDSLDDDHVQYRSEDRSHFGADSTYASTSTEQTIERLFTPHEPKRVTFDLYESQKMAREVSEDSMYNSGESFVPTYPEYSTQQEYGSHGYMYTPCGYASFSPMSSPTMEHSISDVQLFKVSDTPSVHKSHFHEDILQTQEMAPIYEEPIVASSPRKHPRKGTIEVDLTPSMSPLKDRKEPPTESSL